MGAKKNQNDKNCPGFFVLISLEDFFLLITGNEFLVTIVVISLGQGKMDIFPFTSHAPESMRVRMVGIVRFVCCTNSSLVIELYGTENGSLAYHFHADLFTHLHISRFPALGLYPSLPCLLFRC